MTKVVKWWERVSFWNKFKMVCLSVGVSSELGMHFSDVGNTWKIAVGCIAFTGVVIGIVFDDKDSNGIADIFEVPPPLKHKKKS